MPLGHPSVLRLQQVDWVQLWTEWGPALYLFPKFISTNSPRPQPNNLLRQFTPPNQPREPWLAMKDMFVQSWKISTGHGVCRRVLEPIKQVNFMQQVHQPCAQWEEDGMPRTVGLANGLDLFSVWFPGFPARIVDPQGFWNALGE